MANTLNCGNQWFRWRVLQRSECLGPQSAASIDTGFRSREVDPVTLDRDLGYQFDAIEICLAALQGFVDDAELLARAAAFGITQADLDRVHRAIENGRPITITQNDETETEEQWTTTLKTN